MHRAFVVPLLVLIAAPMGPATNLLAQERVQTANGTVEGTSVDGVHAFLGIPFAQPPVGDLRWRPPQPAGSWDGVRQATKFGPRAMQNPVFGDMVFRSDGTSEDCLYLNVWTPTTSPDEPLPVLVYFYGGGFVAGDGSEPRYDGASMANRGIVALTVNYRLNVFGFMAHPELTEESPTGSSGNYGLLDQQAALAWVQENIAAFGGDPNRVTIAGESAGSVSVSAHMVSPLSKHLIAGAIGESGSLLRTLAPRRLADAEAAGVEFADDLGAESLAELRAMPAEEILDATSQSPFRFGLTLDGYFFNHEPVTVFAAGEQSRVPLLAGWNSLEAGPGMVLRGAEPTVENYETAVRSVYADNADGLLEVYDADDDADVTQAATDLAGDMFIGYGTWKWIDLHARTTDQPVYRYYYTRPRPATRDGNTPAASGAAHAAEIEYAMGNLEANEVYAWTEDDYAVSETMQGYFANFVKTGDPNGVGLPEWPAVEPGGPAQYMRIDIESRAETEQRRERYLFLDDTLD